MFFEIRNLSVAFAMYDGFKMTKKYTNVISDINIDIEKGEFFAIVGSSGSGKSILAHAILRLLPKNAKVEGDIIIDNTILNDNNINFFRKNRIAFVPQSVTYLDPLIKVGKQVRGFKNDKKSLLKQRKVFEKYNLCKKSENLYPFQYSGGMIRRALVSIADISESDLIIADEPTPGMDLKNAIKTLNYFREFADNGKTVILITHDIDLACSVADKIAVFYAGTILEITKAKNFKLGKNYLKHPYTKALFDALPQNNFCPISGSQPNINDLSNGCIFFDRCSYRNSECKKTIPQMIEIDNVFVRCINVT